MIAEQSPGLHPTELVILAGRISRFQTNAFGFINTFKPEVSTASAARRSETAFEVTASFRDGVNQC